MNSGLHRLFMAWLVAARGALLRVTRADHGDTARRLAVLDFSYKNTRGHHHALNQLIADAARAAGCRPVVYASRYLVDALRTDEIQPIFRSTAYQPVADAAALAKKAEGIRSQTTVDLLLLPLSMLSASDSVILIHTATPWHLDALITVLAACRARCCVQVFLMLPPTHDVPAELEAAQAQAYKQVWRQARTSGLQVHFWAENQPLANTFRQMGLADIEYLCLPSRALHEAGYPRLQTRPGNAPISFLFIGDPRAEKGFALILDAIQQASQHGPGLEFRLRLTHLRPEDKEILDRYSGTGLDYRVQDFYSDFDYFAELAQADVVLLPYSPVEYRVKNSNIVAEALVCGTPVVIPGGDNSLSRYVEQLAEPCFVEMDSYTGAGLLVAMRVAGEGLESLRQAASRAAGQIREARKPETFMARMLAH